MSGSALMARETFARLRRRIAEIEGRPADGTDLGDGGENPAASRDRRVLSLGVTGVDHRLGGGLSRNALHEIRSETTRDGGAATGFATALLARLTATDIRPVLWVAEEAALREGGIVHGPGLVQFGFDTARLFVVVTRRPEEALWVFEEGLSCSGLGAVLAEIRGNPRVLDLTASRRLALRARDRGVLGLLLRQAAEPQPGAAATRWHVTPHPAATIGDFAAGVGRPAWHLDLERNRAGATGQFDLEWDHGTRSFASAGSALAALPRPRPALPGDRPDQADAAGAVVAYRRAG